jgi:hypothetical protein
MSRLKRYKSRDGRNGKPRTSVKLWVGPTSRHRSFGQEIMKNLTRKQTIELVDILVDIDLTKDCEDSYVSNGYYLIGFLKKYSEVDEKVLDRFINFKTREHMRANGDDPDEFLHDW